MLENLRRKQDLLLQSHKELAEARLLSAVGEGAFSIAHRLGNLLNPVETWVKNVELQRDVQGEPDKGLPAPLLSQRLYPEGEEYRSRDAPV